MSKYVFEKWSTKNGAIFIEEVNRAFQIKTTGMFALPIAGREWKEEFAEEKGDLLFSHYGEYKMISLTDSKKYLYNKESNELSIGNAWKSRIKSKHLIQFFDIKGNYSNRQKIYEARKIKGELIETLVADENAYPVDGLHSDGFYYVRIKKANIGVILHLKASNSNVTTIKAKKHQMRRPFSFQNAQPTDEVPLSMISKIAYADSEDDMYIHVIEKENITDEQIYQLLEDKAVICMFFDGDFNIAVTNTNIVNKDEGIFIQTTSQSRVSRFELNEIEEDETISLGGNSAEEQNIRMEKCYYKDKQGQVHEIAAIKYKDKNGTVRGIE